MYSYLLWHPPFSLCIERYRTNSRKPSPSSTLPGHQSRPVWGRSSSVWRWGRLHPAGGRRGICRSSLGSPSTEPRPPGPTPFSGSDGTARRRWCWHTCQAYLSLIQRKYNWNLPEYTVYDRGSQLVGHYPNVSCGAILSGSRMCAWKYFFIFTRFPWCIVHAVAVCCQCCHESDIQN